MNIGTCAEYRQGKDYQIWHDNRYAKLKEYGFTHIDYNMANTNTVLYTCDDKEFEEKLLNERQLIEKACMSVNQVHGPWQWPPRDSTPEERAERMEKMRKSIRGAALLGCKNWVVHPLMPYGIEDKNTEYSRKTWDINLTFMRELLETAKEYDVTICLENMPMTNFSIGYPTEILKFVKMLDSEHFKICLDTGHVSVYKSGNPADVVRELGNEIRVLHIHDNNGQADQHLIPYFGVIDWHDFGRALRECGFNGVFSYETEFPNDVQTIMYEKMYKLLIELAKEIMD